MNIRPITAGEIRSFRETVLGTFGVDPPDDAASADRLDASFAALVDLDRTAAAFDGGRMVGASATFDLELAIPGGATSMGGLTMVGVMPSHTRRGALRGFIDAHLAGCRERGQVIGGLWASEATIYGRFGFGAAADHEILEIDSSAIALREDIGGDDVRLYHDATGDDEAKAAIVDVFERAWRARPGLYGRSPAWWQHRVFSRDRPGASKNRLRALVTRRGSANTGYVAFKQFPGPPGELPGGRIEIAELHAVDAEAEASLWRFIVSVDLFPRVRWTLAPVDNAGPWLTTNRRCIKRIRHDALWIRINDVAGALAARRYTDDGELVLAVDGDRTRYALAIEGGAATCEPTRLEADLTFARDALGSIYLGGVKPSLLRRAGWIRGSAAKAALADRLFGWPVPPWCCEIF